jgi:hypothetical protein
VVVIVPVHDIAVVALVHIVVIASLAVLSTVEVPRVRLVLVRLAVIAVKDIILTAIFFHDILYARFTATHAHILLKGHSYYELR